MLQRFGKTHWLDSVTVTAVTFIISFGREWIKNTSVVVGDTLVIKNYKIILQSTLQRSYTNQESTNEKGARNDG